MPKAEGTVIHLKQTTYQTIRIHMNNMNRRENVIHCTLSQFSLKQFPEGMTLFTLVFFGNYTYCYFMYGFTSLGSVSFLYFYYL